MLDSYQNVEISDILYCEAMSNYTIVHFATQRKLVKSKTLKFVENELKENNFLRVHSKYLVNVGFIENISEDRKIVQMVNGFLLPISRRRKIVVSGLHHL